MFSISLTNWLYGNFLKKSGIAVKKRRTIRSMRANYTMHECQILRSHIGRQKAKPSNLDKKTLQRHYSVGFLQEARYEA